MRVMVLVAGLAIFAAVAIAVRYHFVAGTWSWRFRALAVLSGINIFFFGRELWLRKKDPMLLAVALALMLASGALFAWAMHASRSARLKLIFDEDQPQAVLRAGPYRHIRHPFYAAYILFWSGCALAALHPVCIAYALLLVPLLVLAAREEEMGFAGSPQAAAYAAYRREAGLFWPRLAGRR